MAPDRAQLILVITKAGAPKGEIELRSGGEVCVCLATWAQRNAGIHFPFLDLEATPAPRVGWLRPAQGHRSATSCCGWVEKRQGLPLREGAGWRRSKGHTHTTHMTEECGCGSDSDPTDMLQQADHSPLSDSQAQPR
jgi:hypothetical protein